MHEFLDNFANPASLAQAWPLLWQGLQLTLLLAVAALPLAFAAGLLLAGLWSLRVRGLSGAVVALIDVLRSFPVLVLLILIFYGLPFLGLRLPNFAAAVLALVLNNAGYFGEILRAGIAGVPAGQDDALRALGLTRLQGLRLVVLPQAVQAVLAPLASNALELVKATSVAAMVALPELLRSARVAQEGTYDPTPLTAAAVLFFMLLWPFARLTARMERRMLARRR
ncbi:MAG: amino acid ABC transporter permease [Janthinobacterium lividum]